MNILQLDQELLLGLNHFFIGRNNVLDGIFKFCAVYLIYALPLILVALWFACPKKREELFLSFLAGIFSWLVITKLIVSNIWFRARPDLDLIGANELIFHRPDYSFPSDHASVLFAITFGLYFLGWKKAGNWFLLYLIVIVIARVVVGVHFPLDIIAGLASGLVGAVLVKSFKAYLIRYIYTPMWLRLLKILKLV